MEKVRTIPSGRSSSGRCTRSLQVAKIWADREASLRYEQVLFRILA